MREPPSSGTTSDGTASWGQNIARATDTALGCFVVPDMIYKRFVGLNIAEAPGVPSSQIRHQNVLWVKTLGCGCGPWMFRPPRYDLKLFVGRDL